MSRWIKVIISFLMFLFCCNVQSRGQNQSDSSWQFCGWYGGGCYPNVEFDPNFEDRAYLVSDVAGIWRSDDLGDNWYQINNGLGNFNLALLKVTPSDSRILYAGTKRGLFVSKDSGESWRPCAQMNGVVCFERPDSYNSIAIGNRAPETLVIGTVSGEVFFSKDAGQSWQVLAGQKRPFGVNSPITALEFSEDEKDVYAASLKGLARYSFQEDSWTILKNCPQGITDLFISKGQPGAIYVAGHKELYISQDGGKSWRKTTPVPEGKTYRVTCFESDEGTILAVVWNQGWKGGVLLSKDKGKTWNKADKKMHPDVLLNPTRNWAEAGGRTASLRINPFNPEIMLRTDWWGVWRSDDGGKSWHEKIKGAANTVGSDIHVDAKGNIYAATMDNGLLKSLDRGKTYTPIFPKAKHQPDKNGHVWKVVSDPKNAQKIIATSSPWDDDVNQVIISQDGGVNFIVVRDGLPGKRPKVNTVWEEGYPRAIAIDHNRPWIVYLGIDGDDGGGLFISYDGGWHWQYSAGQPGSKRIYNALEVDPHDSQRIFWGAGGEEGGVYISENGGKSWQYSFNQMKEVFDLAVNQEGWIYVAGDFQGPAVFISQDRGNSWSLLKRFTGEGTAEALFIHPTDFRKIGVSTVKWDGQGGGEIYWSEDKGKNWRQITGDLPFGEGAAAMAYNPTDFSLYIIRYAGSVYKTALQ